MFVIADNRNKKVPSYLRNIGKDKAGYISIDIRDALISPSEKEANLALSQLAPTNLFEFRVYQLGIVS